MSQLLRFACICIRRALRSFGNSPQDHCPLAGSNPAYGAGKQKRPEHIRSRNFSGGGTGIRTPGTFRHNSFQDCRLQPLGHSSAICVGTP
jgi:hypothetical protein